MMFDGIDIIGFVLASGVLILMPGPDILYVAFVSAAHGAKSGIVTALGLCSGLIVHTSAAALGVSVIFNESPLAFSILKYLGILYLVYLGIKEILATRKAKEENSDTGTINEVDLPGLYKRGIMMNLLNPKVAIFFLAFLPQFILPESKEFQLNMLLLGLVFIVLAITIFSSVSLISGSLKQFSTPSLRFKTRIPFLKAGIYFIISAYILFFD